jgi:hypothetical protein
MKVETIDGLHVGAIRAQATFESSVATNRKENHWGQHAIEAPFTRMITDVTGTYPWRRNGDLYATWEEGAM